MTRVLPLGDSITAGSNLPGAYRVELLRQMRAAGLDVDFVGSQRDWLAPLRDREHEGHSGWCIDDLAAVVPGIGKHRPEVVLLLIGTNDVLSGSDPVRAGQRYAALVDEALTVVPGAFLLVGAVPPLGDSELDERGRALNSAIRDIVAVAAARGSSVTYVDLHAALTAADLADGVHPDEGGYRKIAAAWAEALLPLLAERDAGG